MKALPEKAEWFCRLSRSSKSESKKMNKLKNTLVIAALLFSLIFTFACAPAEKPPPEAEKVNNNVKVTISKRGYEPKEIAVKKGQPVKLEFFREDGENCAEELVFPKLNIKKSLPVGATETVEFTPQESGELGFTCGMDMLRGKVIVSD
jgi:plastocyanin domain-containing protein